MPWLFAFPLEVSAPGKNESVEMHDVQMCIPLLKLFTGAALLGERRKEGMQLQEANLNKLPLHLFQFTGGNIFLHII